MVRGSVSGVVVVDNRVRSSSLSPTTEVDSSFESVHEVFCPHSFADTRSNALAIVVSDAIESGSILLISFTSPFCTSFSRGFRRVGDVSGLITSLDQVDMNGVVDEARGAPVGKYHNLLFISYL